MDERLVAELMSANSAVFEMLMDAVHGREALAADHIIDLLRSLRTDTSLSSNFPKLFSLQLPSSRFGLLYFYETLVLLSKTRVLQPSIS